jgi:hypothetical protein
VSAATRFEMADPSLTYPDLTSKWNDRLQRYGTVRSRKVTA